MRTASKTGEVTDRLKLLLAALEVVPASSTDSERAFSVAGRFLTKLRSRLSPKSIDNYSFGRAYFKNKGYGYFHLFLEFSFQVGTIRCISKTFFLKPKS